MILIFHFQIIIDQCTTKSFCTNLFQRGANGVHVLLVQFRQIFRSFHTNLTHHPQRFTVADDLLLPKPRKQIVILFFFLVSVCTFAVPLRQQLKRRRVVDFPVDVLFLNLFLRCSLLLFQTMSKLLLFLSQILLVLRTPLRHSCFPLIVIVSLLLTVRIDDACMDDACVIDDGWC